MVKHGYNRSKYDSCIYLRGLNDGSFIHLLLYIDDMLMTTQKKSKINKLKKLLSREFEKKDLGAAKKILGMEIHKDQKARKLFLSQQKYIEKVL